MMARHQVADIRFRGGQGAPHRQRGHPWRLREGGDCV